MLNKIVGSTNLLIAFIYLIVTIGNVFMIYGGALVFFLLKIMVPICIFIVNIWSGIKLFKSKMINRNVLYVATTLTAISIITLIWYINFLDNNLAD